jgi:hypothetical protein
VERLRQVSTFQLCTLTQAASNGRLCHARFDTHTNSARWYQSEARLLRLAELVADGVVRDQHQDLQVDLARGWVTRFFAGQAPALLLGVPSET